VTIPWPGQVAYSPGVQYSVDVGYWTGSITYQAAWMTSPVIISIGSGPDANGIGWVWNSIDGWDSPDVAGQVVQRSADHGGWPSPQYYAPRILTLTITASAPSQAVRDLARLLFQQAIPVNDLATLIYNEPLPKQVNFRRSGRITEVCETLTDVTFTCNLVCPDPRKYSVVLKSGPVTVLAETVWMTVPAAIPFTLPAQPPPASVLATNAGTFETRPVVSVNGPLTGPQLVNQQTGQSVTFSTVSLGPGDVLSADFSNQSATLNGAYQAADVSSSWFVLQPGPAVINVTGSQGSGGATFAVTFRDAYM